MAGQSVRAGECLCNDQRGSVRFHPLLSAGFDHAQIMRKRQMRIRVSNELLNGSKQQCASSLPYPAISRPR